MFIITLLTVGVFMILFYIAMAVRESISLIKESTGVLHEVKDIAREAKVIIIDMKGVSGGIKGIVEKVSGTIDTLNAKIIAPILAIGGFLTTVSSFVTGGKNSKKSEQRELSEN